MRAIVPGVRMNGQRTINSNRRSDVSLEEAGQRFPATVYATIPRTDAASGGVRVNRVSCAEKLTKSRGKEYLAPTVCHSLFRRQSVMTVDEAVLWSRLVREHSVVAHIIGVDAVAWWIGMNYGWNHLQVA
jgi:hypothetical protein